MRRTEPLPHDAITFFEMPVTGSIDTGALTAALRLSEQRQAVRRFVDAARYARAVQSELQRQACSTPMPMSPEGALMSACHRLFMEAMSYFHEHLEPKEAMPAATRRALARLYNASCGSFASPGVLFADLRMLGGCAAGRDGSVASAIGMAEQALLSVRMG